MPRFVVQTARLRWSTDWKVKLDQLVETWDKKRSEFEEKAEAYKLTNYLQALEEDEGGPLAFNGTIDKFSSEAGDELKHTFDLPIKTATMELRREYRRIFKPIWEQLEENELVQAIREVQTGVVALQHLKEQARTTENDVFILVDTERPSKEQDEAIACLAHFGARLTLDTLALNPSYVMNGEQGLGIRLLVWMFNTAGKMREEGLNVIPINDTAKKYFGKLGAVEVEGSDHSSDEDLPITMKFYSAQIQNILDTHKSEAADTITWKPPPI